MPAPCLPSSAPLQVGAEAALIHLRLGEGHREAAAYRNFKPQKKTACVFSGETERTCGLGG